MKYPEFHYTWTYHLKSSPEALWPLVSDTNQFDHDTGVPPVERRDDDSHTFNNARRRLRLHRFGIPVEWEEEPFEWVRPYRFGVARRYSRGPIAELRIQAELNRRPDGGTDLIYQVNARSANLFSLIAIPAQIGLLNARSFAATFHRYDRLASLSQIPLALDATSHLTPDGRARLANIRKQLHTQGQADNLIDHMIATIDHGDDLLVARMRPYELADKWGITRREVLEFCLYATRAGMLDFRWDMLCPLCRGSKQNGSSLRDINPQVHCETCNIDFRVNFDRSVELTFRPNPSIRKIEATEFCVAGPQFTPHIMAQQLLRPGEKRSLTISLEPGRHRVRTLSLPGGYYLAVMPGGPSEASFSIDTAGWPEDEPLLNTNASIQIENTTPAEQLFVLEHMAWGDKAVTAADVTSLQLFRDLFSNEALRPDEQIDVGSMTIVFTDLRGSTQLYRQIGDAPAFGKVMNHFDLLRTAIAREDGALIKTIGDAVMAAFRQPQNALRAMLHAQRELAEAEDSVRLKLKVGIHRGPSIAVTLNERLDYFGSTINMAARLEGLSSGEDIIISDAVHADPLVGPLLAEGDYRVESFHAPLKGFESEDFKLWRIIQKTASAPHMETEPANTGRTGSHP